MERRDRPGDVVTGRDVAVITPWYPTRHQPFAGAFVRAMVEATAPGCDSVTVYHLDGWSARASDADVDRAWAAQRELLARGMPVGKTVGGADLAYLPVPVRSGVSFAAAATRAAEAIRVTLRGKPIPAPVIHGHVGLRGGWTGLQNAAPGARVFVTEHATYLDRLLSQPDSRAMYDEVLARVTGFFAVGEPVRRPLVEAFPHHAEKIGMIPNPIPFNQPRDEPVTALRRWLFLGYLSPRKGVDWLVEAFAMCHADDGSLTLTIVGDGALLGALRARTTELGIAGAVTFVGAVPPEEALRLLREHDLLVHPSRFETFGMTVIEAIAVGTPVLVTRCGGPEETLAGIETDASELIEVEEGTGAIVDGYRNLRRRFPHGLDIARAQRVLAERYGYPAVARAHHALWFPDTPTTTTPAAPGATEVA